MANRFENMALKIDDLGRKQDNFLRKITNKVINGLNAYSDFVLDEKVYAPIRKMTKPLHWTWIKGYLESLKKEQDEWPFKKPGVYICVGGPGAGKSSFAMQFAQYILDTTGKGSYINTAIELPRTDENGRRYKYHPQYEITDFFDDGEIKVYPNQYLYGSLQIDEAHRVWQYRENQSSEYMRSFKGFMSYAVGVRHYIKYIFLYTQMEKVDTQIMSLSEKLFEIAVDKGFDYEHWMKTGQFKVTILGWWLQFFKLVSNGMGGHTRIQLDRVYIKRTFDLDYFNTYNLRDELKGKKMDNRYNVKEVRL